VHEGQNVRVTVDGADSNYSGALPASARYLAAESVLVVEADVSNDGRCGPFVRSCEIVTDDSQPAVTIPANALVVFCGIEKVIVIVDGKAVGKSGHHWRRGDN